MFADGDSRAEPLRSVEGGEFRGRIESVNQPFQFTVTAGDDRTSIRDVPVKVVPPPTLKSLAVRLIPPEYTGMPAQVLAPGLTQLAGARGDEARARGGGQQAAGAGRAARRRRAAGGELAFDKARTGIPRPR